MSQGGGGANVPPKFTSFKQSKPKQPNSRPEYQPRSNHQQANGRVRQHRGERTEVSANPKFKMQKPTPSRDTLSKTPKMQPAESDFFVMDVHGDPKNVEYGCLHRYSIPAYHRSGSGYVIGAPSSVRIDRDASTDKEIVLSGIGGSKESGKLLSSRAGDIGKKHALEVFAMESGEAEEEQDFVALKRKQISSGESNRMVGSGIWNFIEDGATSHEED